MKLNILIFVIVALLSYGATLYFDHQKPGVISQPEAPEENGNGDLVPEFVFTTPDGEAHNIRDFKGRIVLLNFWASWCPPCVKEFPQLLKIAASYPDDVVLIALSSDLDDSAMLSFLKKHPRLEKNILVALDKDQNITQKIFYTFKLPETIVVGRDQKMIFKIVGADWTTDDIVKKIDTVQH